MNPIVEALGKKHVENSNLPELNPGDTVKVFVRIVVMAFILVSYSLKPVRTGSIVNAYTRLDPAVIAALVMR